MKLCIVTHCVVKGDGQGRVNYEVTKELLRHNHHVTLVASSVSADLQQNSQVDWIFIAVNGWPTKLLQDMVFAQQSADWLRKHSHEFDLVKVNGAITWAQADVNAVHFVHNSWLRSPVHTSRLRRDFYGFYQWLYTVLNVRSEKRAFRRAKVVVAVSEKVRKELLDVGVPKEYIRVIFNGVDLHEFSPGSADRRKLGLPEDVALALFAGDIRTPRKNLDTVLHALIQVPELHLAVAGSMEGSPYPQLSHLLGLGGRVHFLGYRCDVSALMQAVDLFVFPSRYEPCGLVLLEAMASGLPIVTATTVGCAEIIKPSCGVVLCNSDDAQAFAQALRTLACDRELRHQMGQAARAVAEQYSWTSMAQSYINLFEELVSHDYYRSHTHLSPSKKSGILP